MLSRIIYKKPINTVKQIGQYKQYKQHCETVITAILFYTIVVSLVIVSWGLTPIPVSQ